MDQVVMVNARPLQWKAINEGRRLIRALCESRFDVVAAFWLFSSDSDRWRLLIASPIRDREGGVQAYSRLGSVYDSIDFR
jgi:hypothetical protein